MSLLVLKDLTREFGSVAAVEGVDTTLEEGEIRGLIGPNGAGKTTLVNLLSGFLTPTRGEIVFGGARIERTPAHQRVEHGVGRTFQTPQVCAGLSTLDNIVLGSHRRLATARLRNLAETHYRQTVTS